MDKVVHFTLYLVLGLLALRTAPNASWRVAIIAVVAIAAFGAVDEWHQRFVPGRSADPRDWVADALGGGAGAALALAARRRRESVS